MSPMLTSILFLKQMATVVQRVCCESGWEIPMHHIVMGRGELMEERNCPPHSLSNREKEERSEVSLPRQEVPQ